MPAIDYSKVAHLYDIYVKTDVDVPFFLKEAQGCDNVLELMAGTGRVSIPLIEAGLPLTCIDSSGEMLAILRGKLEDRGLSAEIYEMDVCNLSLRDTFDLIILPFNSFAEIVSPSDQRNALSAIREHLSHRGRFICTLHNPLIRLASVDGQLKQYGKYYLPDNTGTLILSAIENYEPERHMVSGSQFYEIRDTNGKTLSKYSIDITFYLHEKNDFEAFIQSQGFSIRNLFGDYSYSQFEPDTSPFMIWILEKGDSPLFYNSQGRRKK
ncbi:MAG: class I SAM-dependent methyltransferase [Gemmatimonadota bacterium]|nr:MAG: class I SAM-dependent methyltransferase [Gemmatimonadota bacterium]